MINNRDNEILCKIIELASQYHMGQFRKDSNIPYIVHPVAVGETLISFGITDVCVIAAAYLHDVLEDCEVTENQLFNDIQNKTTLADFQIYKILSIVKNLTFKTNQTGYLKKYAKSFYLAEIASNYGKDFDTFIIKVVDRLCNIFDFYQNDNIKYARKYMMDASALFGALFHLYQLDMNNSVLTHLVNFHDYVAKEISLK